MKSILRFFICILLAFSIIFSGFINVSAALVSNKNSITQQLTDSYLSETVEWEPIKTDALNSISFFSRELPSVTGNKEVLWYDRLANKPLYAQEFYNWLIENSKTDGALVTATDFSLSNTIEAHLVAELSGKKNFEFDFGATADQIKQAASEAIAEDVEIQFFIASKWISEIMACFDHDYPEVFWLGNIISTSYGWSSSISYDPYTCVGTVDYIQNIYLILKNGTFDLRAEVYRDKNTVIEDISARDSIIENLCNQVRGKSDYEKIKFFNNFITTQNGYNADLNTASPEAWECISALKCIGGRKAPVCEGYSRAFKVLCNKVGIPCVLSTGDAGGAHMWNYVELEEEWYAVDVTWNDPGLLTEGKPTSGIENENYLLVGADTLINGESFAKSHILSNTPFENGVVYLNSPQLSLVSYNARISHKCSHKNGRCTFCSCSAKDINRNGLVDITDFVSLKGALLSQNDIGNFDCNLDGSINGVDLSYLKKILWETI